MRPTGMELTRKIGLFITFFLFATLAAAQPLKDTSAKKRVQPRKIAKDLYNDAINSIQRNPGDTINTNAILIAKSEQAFRRYEGKIIRNITVKHFGFERTFADTSTRIGYFGTKVLNSLHTDTRTYIIKQNLFIKENRPLNPAKLADNERYLRTLGFIQDARIFVTPVPGSSDSVDLLVITKDLFTLAAVLDVSSTSVRARLAEANFLGMGQRIQGTVLWEQNRTPRAGYELLYSKTNIGGSFINGTIAYTQINTGRSEGIEDEGAFYVRFERPLVSPFSQFAGATEVSVNQSNNVYSKPDSLFQRYKYNVYDAWVGYNLGSRKLEEGENYENNRNRLFVSARYMQTNYLKTPAFVGDGIHPIYNSRKMLLGQLSLFRQDFYKLNYIYGFGVTEDVPMGYNVSITGGWTRHLNIERPYAGFQAQQYIVSPKGGFIDAVFKVGGYYRNNRIEDASTLLAINFFTRLLPIYRWKNRNVINISITNLRNRVTYEPLRINNDYGLKEFSTDSVAGVRRISLYGESILYTNKKIFGFRFAPFASVGVSIVNPENLPFIKSDGYSGIGAGIRTRNENLIFGTIEAHVMYFPRPVYNVGNFRVDLRSDIRFRYKTNFVNAPDVVHLNRSDL